MKKNKNKFSIFLQTSIIFLISSMITALIFKHRLLAGIYHMPLPDNDFEGTMWVSWYFAHLQSQGLSPLISDLFSFPYSFDYSEFIVGNFTTDIIQGLLRLTEPNLLNTIAITNVLSFLSYPLSAMAAFWLARELECTFAYACLAGVAYAFSYSHIMDGRGIMVLGQYWMIPLSLAQTLRLFQKPNIRNSLWVGLLLGLQLGFDGYYGFYSIATCVFIYSCLTIWHYDRNIVTLLTRFFYCWSTAALTVIAVNLQFIVTNISFVFSQSSRASIQRSPDFSNALQTVENFFLPSFESYQADFIKNILHIEHSPGASLLSYTLAVSALIGLFMFRRLKKIHRCLYIASFLGILIVISIATTVEIGTPIRDFYFHYFEIFRSVGRLNHYYTLFFVIAMSISMTTTTNLNIEIFKSNIFQFITASIIGLLIILEGLNHSDSWYKTVDLEVPNSLFKPLKENPDIKRIAFLPNTFPGYSILSAQQLAQMVHQKPIFGNIHPGSYFKKELHPEQGLNFNLMERFINMGFDTFVIYNYYHHHGYPIHPHEMLVVDPRIGYSGSYAEKPKGSRLDASFDISVYQVKKLSQKNHDFANRSQFKINGFPTKPIKITNSYVEIDFPHTENIHLFSWRRPWEVFTSPYKKQKPQHSLDYKTKWNITKGNHRQWGVLHLPSFLRYIAMKAAYFLTILIFFILILNNHQLKLRSEKIKLINHFLNEIKL